MREDFSTQSRRPGRPLKHRVLLTEIERRQLAVIEQGASDELKRKRARVLLALDEGESTTSDRPVYEQIAKTSGVSKSTVFTTARRFVTKGLEATLDAHRSGAKFTHEEEARLGDLVNLYNQESKEWSVRGLAKQLGRSPMAVNGALSRLAERGEIVLLEKG